MTREILFKAKRLDNGEWVEGNIVYVPEDADFMPGAYILPRLVSARADPPTKGIMLGGFFEVDPATVCEYTNIDTRREAWPSSEVHKIFTGDMLGEKERLRFRRDRGSGFHIMTVLLLDGSGAGLEHKESPTGCHSPPRRRRNSP